MAKDELHPGNTCPECNQENQRRESAEADDSCSCCSCSCSDTSDTDGKKSDGSRVLVDIEKQKKDLLSSLSIQRTNREPATIQHLLQFVEALTHAPEFFRRYNLLDDFCLDCLINEPTYLCCSNANRLQDSVSPGSSCGECNGSTEVTSGRSPPSCSECTRPSKPLPSRRQRAEARRDRRRRRRRRYARHVPRTSTEHSRAHCHCQDPASSNTDCFDDRTRGNCKSNPSVQTSHESDCDECVHGLEQNCSLSRACHDSASGTTDFDQRTDEAVVVSDCVDCVKTKRGQKMRKNRQSHRRIEEDCCSGCSAGSSRTARSSKKFSLGKGRGTRSEDVELRSFQGKSATAENDQPSGCSCDDCQTNSESSDESCDDCKAHSSKKNF